MLVGQRNIALGDTRRFHVRYSDWLTKGAKITTAPTVTVPAGTSSHIGTSTIAPGVDPDEQGVFFYVVSGSVLNEAFTVSIVVTDTLNQVVNDTLNVIIVSP
jgi:hypothetical protein